MSSSSVKSGLTRDSDCDMMPRDPSTDDTQKTKTELIQELQQLRQRVAQLETDSPPVAASEADADDSSEGHASNGDPSVDSPELQQSLEDRTNALREANDQLVSEIVERNTAEHELRSAKNKLEILLEAVPGVVSWIDRDLHYLGVNNHLADLFNAKPEDFVGRDLGFLGTGSEFRNFVEAFFEFPTQEASQEVKAIIDGQVKTFLIVAQKFDNDRAAFTIGIDITDRRQAEMELLSAKDQLQAILEAVPGMVSWIDRDLRYIGVNRHLAETFNLPADSFSGQDIGFLDTSAVFQGFLREFFDDPDAQEALKEIDAKVYGEMRSYLIAARKYDRGNATFTVGIDITEQHRALSALRQAETKYRNIFENAVEGIFQISIDGHYLSANPALARIYGYESPEEMMASLSSFEQQLYVDRADRARAIEQLHREGQIVGFEQQIYRQDGTTTWISENARVVRDDAEQILYYEGTVEDITERKTAQEALQQANEELESRVEERTAALRQSNQRLMLEVSERERVEAALRNSEAELRALFAAMTDVITVFDAQGRYVKIVTTNSETIYSPTADRLGKSVYEIFPAAKASIFVRHIQRALNTGQTVSLEYSLNIPDAPEGQREVWFAASVSPMPDNCAIWVARNITERKRVLDALQQAEEKFRSIFENAAEGIFQIAPDGRCLNGNPALVEMFGYDSFDDLQGSVSDMASMYVDRVRHQEFVHLLEDRSSIANFELKARRKDGSLMWISENARAVRDRSGHLMYYEGTVQDITKRREAEDALRVEQEKSERLLLNVLPQSIAERLKDDDNHIADRFEEATILFADLVNFTTISSQMPPGQLVDVLNEIFSTFDQLALDYHLEKIKTIGDAYMVAGGIPQAMDDHAGAIAEMALEMQWAIERAVRTSGEPFELRIGINTGPVVAGVIGIRKFTYDLWGDTVNLASRMESHGQPGAIQVTKSFYERTKDRYLFESRGEIDVKGRGRMPTYWLRGRRPREC
ncbi:MAG: adenylate/guanylate cyclase domain-containing protein [Geitlerinemataceae cyanobacterium]